MLIVGGQRAKKHQSPVWQHRNKHIVLFFVWFSEGAARFPGIGDSMLIFSINVFFIKNIYFYFQCDQMRQFRAIWAIYGGPWVLFF